MKKTLQYALGLLFWIAPTAAIANAAISSVNWPGHGGAPDESSYSTLDQINSKNVKKLGLASSLDLEGEQSLEATPIAIDGVLYFTGSYSTVYAVNAASSELIWKYDPEIWKHNPTKMHYALPVNRGAAYADGRVFSCTLDGRLLALDSKTGKLLWSVQTVPLESKHTCTGAPRTFNGKIIIGNGGADFAARGFVTAYDAVTGKQLWRFYTVPGAPEENKGDPAMERAAATWHGEYWKTGTGGTAWNGITFDPELNRLYIGTGNGGPYDPEQRSPGGGDNLYLASIVALDADTGRYIWHYQVNPLECWDYKATMNIVAATLPIDGKLRKVLLQSPTNGFFYVLDRETGHLISAEKTGKVTWAERIDLATGRPVEAKNIRYEKGEVTMWPSNQGTHNWQSMSFNPGTGLVYIPYMQLGVKFWRVTGPSRSGVKHQFLKEDAEDGTGTLLAWDPVAQKARWKVQHPGMWNGGTMTTGGSLVFQGTADGFFDAYDAVTGKRLWRFKAGLGIVSDPISYAVAGKQYVSVLVGYGGASTAVGEYQNMGWKYGAQKRRLLTFSLGSKAVLPPSAPPSFTIKAVDDPAIKISEADVQAGSAIWGNCTACHGPEASSSGSPGPDLRESSTAMDLESLWIVLHEGSLLEHGMPRFEQFTRDQVRQLHAFIRSKAREVLSMDKH